MFVCRLSIQTNLVSECNSICNVSHKDCSNYCSARYLDYMKSDAHEVLVMRVAEFTYIKGV